MKDMEAEQRGATLIYKQIIIPETWWTQFSIFL